MLERIHHALYLATGAGGTGGKPITAISMGARKITVRIQKTEIGHLEKLVSIPIACCSGVNVHESERERNEIICRQFCGVGALAPIFRGAQRC